MQTRLCNISILTLNLQIHTDLIWQNQYYATTVVIATVNYNSNRQDNGLKMEDWRWRLHAIKIIFHWLIVTRLWLLFSGVRGAGTRSIAAYLWSDKWKHHRPQRAAPWKYAPRCVFTALTFTALLLCCHYHTCLIDCPLLSLSRESGDAKGNPCCV